MDDYALVLNAGSSSLKFCVFARPQAGAWALSARGQVEGIGTAPRLYARDGAGNELGDQALDAGVRDGRGALDALAAWLRSRFGGARVLGVGHRVVHGGALHAGPAIVTPQVLEGLRALVPLAPLHQPHNLAAIEAVRDRLPDVPQVACFDTSFHRGQPAVLMAAGLGPGDEAIVPTCTMAATAFAVIQCGAVPVFADSDPTTFNISPADVKRKISEYTKAIILFTFMGSRRIWIQSWTLPAGTISRLSRTALRPMAPSTKAAASVPSAIWPVSAFTPARTLGPMAMLVPPSPTATIFLSKRVCLPTMAGSTNTTTKGKG